MNSRTGFHCSSGGRLRETYCQTGREEGKRSEREAIAIWGSKGSMLAGGMGRRRALTRKEAAWRTYCSDIFQLVSGLYE